MSEKSLFFKVFEVGWEAWFNPASYQIKLIRRDASCAITRHGFDPKEL